MEYPITYIGAYQALVSIFNADGSVTVVHAGVECGQGINTKVLQVAAATLGIPYDTISVKRMDNVVGANSFCTSASSTSESICFVCYLYFCYQLI